MVDHEVVPPPHRSKHRPDDVLGHILDSLAVRADEMVVMLGIARDVRGHVTIALETAGHPVLDLLLQGAVDRGAADRWVRRPDAIEELLC